MAGTHTSITLDGQPYKLRYDWDAFAVLHEEGIAVDDIPELEDNPRVISTLLWAGLLHDNPQFTERDVARLFMPRDIPNIVERIGVAIQQAMPEGEADEGNPTRPKTGRKPSRKRKEPPSESSG